MSSDKADLTVLLGANTLQLKGQDFPLSNLANKTVAFYFSAHWCPPCRAFTPHLIAAYKAAKAAGTNFELIFVSSDQDQEGFDEYYKNMPWPSVKYDEEETRERVGEFFGIEGIPSLQVINKDGKRLTDDENGQTSVIKQQEKAFEQWAKQ